MSKDMTKQMIDEINDKRGKKVKFLLVSEHGKETKFLSDSQGTSTTEELEAMVVNNLVTLFSVVVNNTDLNPINLVKLLLTSSGQKVRVLSSQDEMTDYEMKDGVLN